MTTGPISVTLTADVSRFVKAMKRAAEHTNRYAHRFSVAFMPERIRRRHHRRCGICSPFANPAPLSFNGAAYRRKTRSRRGSQR